MATCPGCGSQETFDLEHYRERSDEDEDALSLRALHEWGDAIQRARDKERPATAVPWLMAAIVLVLVCAAIYLAYSRG